MENKKTIKSSIPDAHLLLSSLRAVGYIEETAIADIVDNCISAEATEINIEFDWNNKRISILDNGIGMDSEELFKSMRIGSSNPNEQRKHYDLGRFGMGMKTAAFSLGKRLTVITKKDGVEANACWDLDYVETTREWDLIVYKDDDEIIRDANEKFKNIGNGTVVFIEILDKMIDENNVTKSKTKFYNAMNKVSKHLGLVFHRFVDEDEVIINVNNNLVLAWDPFVLCNNATQELSPEVHYENGKKIIIEPFILPHKNKFDSDEKYKQAGGIKGWQQHQGFYVYRNRRLLVYGTWFGLFRKEPSFNLARIKLDINSDSDFDWQIDIKKSKAVPPVYIEELIEQVANICGEKSATVYNSRGAYLKNTNSNSPQLSYVWEQRKSSTGEYKFYLNKKHSLLLNLKKSLDEENKNILNSYLALVENFSPVMLSGVADAMHNLRKNNSLSIVDDIAKQKDLLHIRSLIKIFLKNGYIKEEILSTLMDMKNYTYLKDEIKQII